VLKGKFPNCAINIVANGVNVNPKHLNRIGVNALIKGNDAKVVLENFEQSKHLVDTYLNDQYVHVDDSELKYKAINVHASLLPKLRGGSPLHRCLIDGYKETGVTIMYMAPGMDDGDIITQRGFDILDTYNVGDIHDKLSVLGSELLYDTLPSIFDGTNERIKQDENLVTFAYNIKKEEEKLDFSKSAKDVHNQIRGLYPFPTSYTTLNGEIIKICESRIGNVKSGKIGEIVSVYEDGIGVMCNDKEIIVTKLKPAGKKEMRALDFVNGRGKDKLMGEILC
jgi:methionyl-tRNA formyltransferase